MPADGLPTVTIGTYPNTAKCAVKGQGADHRETNRGGAASGVGPNMIICAVPKAPPVPDTDRYVELDLNVYTASGKKASCNEGARRRRRRPAIIVCFTCSDILLKVCMQNQI